MYYIVILLQFEFPDRFVHGTYEKTRLQNGDRKQPSPQTARRRNDARKKAYRKHLLQLNQHRAQPDLVPLQAPAFRRPERHFVKHPFFQDNLASSLEGEVAR